MKRILRLCKYYLYPLNYYGRPQLNKPSEGRFVIKSTEFLDPAVYAKDKEITVAGTLARRYPTYDRQKNHPAAVAGFSKLFIYGRSIKIILTAMVIQAWVVMVLIPILDMDIMAARFIGADTIDLIGKIRP